MSIRYNRKIRFFPQEMHIPSSLTPFFPAKTAPAPSARMRIGGNGLCS
jgi:hypothetical protein